MNETEVLGIEHLRKAKRMIASDSHDGMWVVLWPWMYDRLKADLEKRGEVMQSYFIREQRIPTEPATPVYSEEEHGE